MKHSLNYQQNYTIRRGEVSLAPSTYISITFPLTYQKLRF